MACNSSVFGNTSQFIKLQGSDIVAIQGVNTLERLIGGDIRIPYKQILKSRVILKSGQVNYLLNHLGLGDNATFIAIKATYNSASVFEEDNYISWNYYDDFSRTYAMKELMILTGNSTHRIKQIYLTNPNTNYPVSLDIMVAVIDDEVSFFTDTVNQIGLSFINLNIDSIETYVLDQSLVIYDNGIPRSAIAYLTLSNINSIQRIGKLLILDDTSLGTLFMDFETEYDAQQSHSLINYVQNTSGISIQNLPQKEDSEPPVVFFYTNLGDDAVNGATISLSGTSSLPTNSSMWSSGETFSVTLDSSTYSFPMQKSSLIDLIIASASDNRDGVLYVTASNILLLNPSGAPVTFIPAPPTVGTWSITLILEDIAGNDSPDIKFDIYVI